MKKISYDPIEDAAYIYFQDRENTTWVVWDTYSCDYQGVGGMINIDFDEEGKIFWIEFMPASQYFSDEILSK